MNALSTRLRVRLGPIAMAAMALLASACSRGSAPGHGQLIDALGEENVVATPLAGGGAGPAGLAEIPLLDDLGSGPNPYGLKRRLDLGNVSLTALAAVPPTRLRFRMRPPADAMLSFTYGIRRDDAVFSGRVESRRTVFRIEVEDGGNRRVAFEKELVVDRGRSLAFNLRKIDLGAFAGREIALSFVTEGDPEALAFWFHPFVFARRSDSRNLVLISLDTLRADHLGCYGYGRPTSPAIDALAADGTLFERAYAPSTWTLPSHMSLLTGLEVASHRVSDGDLKLGPGLATLADRLKAGDFFTTAVTGGGYVSGDYGFQRGFDSYRVEGEIRDSGSADVIGRAACRILEDHGDRAFFLFVHTYQIHSPFFPPEEYASAFAGAEPAPRRISFEDTRLSLEKRFQPLSEETRRDLVALYDGEIRYTDAALVKPIVETLKSLGLYERTMLVLVGDHGEEFFEHGGWSHAHQAFEEILKVPLIVKPAGRAPAGRRIATPVSLTDVAPTVLDAFGIRFRAGDFDGRTLFASISGRAAKLAGRPVFAAQPARETDKRLPARSVVIRDPFKLVASDAYDGEALAYFDPDPPAVESLALFDLAADPGEKTNLAASRPDLTRTLARLLTARLRPRKGAGPSRLILDGDLMRSLKSLGYIDP